MLLKCSGMEETDTTGKTCIFIDAPPDICAVTDDGIDRGRMPMHEPMRGKRLFVCGLVTDFCVVDTCINAMAAGFTDGSETRSKCRHCLGGELSRCRWLELVARPCRWLLLNVAGSSVSRTVFLVPDAARAVHIHGIGPHGTGFITDPKEVVSRAVSPRRGSNQTGRGRAQPPRCGMSRARPVSAAG